ncbi:hypothetical protein SDC9_80826 [bioreactor metagenome]|uniref:Uncharacterized protein n=1 Tax=bioreactor metagenome TaxID=1076179 RepID=A0A644Z852_9ZZZZ
MDAALLQLACGLNALPGGGNLDEHAINVHALGLVELNDALGARHRRCGVERQSGIHFGRYTAGDDRQNLAAEAHDEPIHQLTYLAAAPAGHALLQQRRIFGLLHGLQDQRGIGRRVLRLESAELVKVSGVSDNGGELFESFELIHAVNPARHGLRSSTVGHPTAWQSNSVFAGMALNCCRSMKLGNICAGPLHRLNAP